MESGSACYGDRCREHEEICSNVCKQYDLQVPSLSGINTALLGARVPGTLQLALRRLREHTQQAEELPCASLSTSPPISTQSARSPLLLPAASGSSFCHQPVEKFSSQFWYCRDDEMPAQSSLGKDSQQLLPAAIASFSQQPGAAALVREAAADQVPLGAAFVSSLSQPPSAASRGFPVAVGNGLFQSASTPNTLKKPLVMMADRKAAVLGKHQRHDFL